MDELRKLAIDQEFIGLLDKEVIRRKDINTARSEGYDEGIQAGLQQGIQAGLQQGIQEGKIQTAKTMLEHNIPIEDVCKYTGLIIEQINEYLNKEL